VAVQIRTVMQAGHELATAQARMGSVVVVKGCEVVVWEAEAEDPWQSQEAAGQAMRLALQRR
jgi:hypothetical protein